MTEHPYIRRALASARARDAGSGAYMTALAALYGDLTPCLRDRPRWAAEGVLDRFAEPDRASLFPVTWRDGEGRCRLVRGACVLAGGVLGPRLWEAHLRPGFGLDSARTAAMDGALRHALAGLPAGAAAVGADVDPAAMDRDESERFCAAFLEGLLPHLPDGFRPGDWAGQVPARELTHLTGRYARHLAALGLDGPPVGDPPAMGRAQAEGWGMVWFAQQALHRLGTRLDGQQAVVTGRDGAGPWAGEKAARLGARVTAIGDGTGCLYAAGGLLPDLLRAMGERPGMPLLLWALRAPGAEFRPGADMAGLEADVVFLCGGPTDEAAARRIAARRPLGVFESCSAASPAAAAVFAAMEGLYGPAIAAGAGADVMACRQRDQRLTRWEADRQLRTAMEGVFRTVWEESVHSGAPGDLLAGARRAAFRPLAEALLARGI